MARHPDFLRLLLSTGVSSVGDQITLLALPAMVVVLTGRLAETGFVAAVEALPFLAALHLGRMVDRRNRRLIMVLAQLVSFVALASVPVAAAAGTLHMPQLYVVALLEGSAMVAFGIARISALPQVLPAGLLRVGAATVSAAESSALLIGPAVSGLLLSVLPGVTGPATAYGLDAVSFLLCGLLVVTIRTPLSSPAGRPAGSVLEGLRYIGRSSGLKLVLALSVSRMALVSPGLIFVYAQAQRLGIGTALLGTLFSLSAVGGLAGSALAVPVTARISMRQVSVLVHLLLALAFGLQAAAPGFGLLLVGEILFSLGLPILSSAQLAYRLSLIPDGLAGRINAASRMAVYGSAPLGLALGATLLAHLGPVAVLALTSAGLALIAGVSAVARWDRPEPLSTACPGGQPGADAPP